MFVLINLRTLLLTFLDEESWLSSRREERCDEFAPPPMYSTDPIPAQTDPVPIRPQTRRPSEPLWKRSLYGSGPERPFAASSTGSRVYPPADTISTVLQSIRSEVEKSQTVASSSQYYSAPGHVNRQFFEVHGPPLLEPISCFATTESVTHFESAPVTPSTSMPTLDPGNASEDHYCTLPPVSNSAVGGLSTFCKSEALATLDDISAVGPQPAHYCSAPSAPKPKLPKYERVFLHDLPPTLPLPPVAGSSVAQYPSQEEVIGPKRRKESHGLSEKDAVRNWQRQFDSKPPTVTPSPDAGLGDSRQLKPKNIPFASPYIQAQDSSAKFVEDNASKQFDPTKPPPSAQTSGP